jgi:hypothetical protein
MGGPFPLPPWFFLASTPKAAAAECQPNEDTSSYEIHVDVDIGVPNIYNNRSKAQLGSRNSHGRRRQVLGTMQGEVDLRWFIDYKIEDFKGRKCFWVASANVSLSYHQLDVNVARECPSSKYMGPLSLFHNGGSGLSWIDVKPLGADGSSGGFGWSVF